MEDPNAGRRQFLKSAGAALTTSLFTGSVRGANDRLAAAFIGMGRMGTSNLEYAMRQPNLQVVAVCDVFDALTHERPYKRAWTIEEAVGELVAERGRFFDPDLVDLFVDQVLPNLPG